MVAGDRLLRESIEKMDYVLTFNLRVSMKSFRTDVSRLGEQKWKDIRDEELFRQSR